MRQMAQSTQRRPRVVLYNPRAVFYTMPLALLALASGLDRRRLEVVIVDGRLEADPIRAVVDLTREAVCLGVTVLTGAPIRDALAVSRAVKAAHPACPVVWGGWHPSLFDRQCLDEPSVDIVVRGQGEETFGEVVNRLVAGVPVAGCPGTTVRTPASPHDARMDAWTRGGNVEARGTAGDVVRAGARPLRDLNAFAPHDYSLIPVERYFTLKRARQVDYISSQGCRFRCAFCADPAVYARGWTGLPPERIAEEAAQLARQYGMEELAFQDETFFTSPPRVDALAEALLRRGLRITWTATLRADQACRMGEALFAKAVASGLRRVMVGVESGSQETLDWLDKDMTIDQVHRTAALCLRYEVGAIFNFIVGFPGEPDASVRATLALAKTLRRMHPAFETPIFYYRPYPGSARADRLAEAGPSAVPNDGAAAGGRRSATRPRAVAHVDASDRSRLSCAQKEPQPRRPRHALRPRGREGGGIEGSRYTFPQTLEGWADFDYVSSRGPWVSDALWRTVERFKFYTRHAWRPGAAAPAARPSGTRVPARWHRAVLVLAYWGGVACRWPLRKAAEWRCERDWYGAPIEKFLVELVRPPHQLS